MTNEMQRTITDLSIRFDPRNSLHNLETVLADPLLRALYRGLLSGPLVYYRPSIHDVQPVLKHGTVGYMLNQNIADSFWTDIQRIAQIIHCSANDVDPFSGNGEIPMDIPNDALTEISLEMPAISLAMVYNMTPFADPLSSRELVVECVQILKAVGFYFVNWMAEAVRRSVKKGMGSLWNFGAFYGMPRQEFIARARNGYNGGRFDELREEVELNQERYDSTLGALAKKDDDVVVLRLTDGKDFEIRVIDPEDPPVVADCTSAFRFLTLEDDD
jgi:hypothetical protein